MLIRMRSQVQVLAGPPPIVAGQSTAGSEPGALAAGLGRAGAARPFPPARPVAPPGPPTRRQARRRPPTVIAHPAEDDSHAAAAVTSRCSLPLVPTAQPPATGAPDAGLACLVAQRTSAAAAARTQPGGPGPPPTSHGPTRLRQRRPRPGLPDLGPQRHRLSMGGDGRVRTDGGRHQTAGHRTGWTADGWTLDG